MKKENSFNELLDKIKNLRTIEHETQIKLLQLLGEFDRKKYYRDAGYSNLFNFLVDNLKYSKPAASRRMLTARAIRDYPLALELLQSYEVSLTTLSMVSRELNSDNSEKILNAISGKSRAYVEKYLVLAKGTTVVTKKEKITPIAIKPSASTPTNGEVQDMFMQSTPEQSSTLADQTVYYQLSFKVSEECMEKLKEVQSLLLRKEAQPTLEKVFESALDSFLDNKSPRRRNARRKQHTKPTPKTLTPRIKDLVLQKSDYRCSYIAEDGTRCDATSFLEVDHITPKALGGSNSIENLRCLCSAHNKLEAEEVFGGSYMGQFYS